MKMHNAFLTFLLLVLPAACSLCIADDWGQITEFEFRSENGNFELSIQPQKTSPFMPGHCRGTLYHVAGKVRTKIWSRFLINDYAPGAIFVANSGEYVVTMDEWQRAGQLPVVIYDSRGGLVSVHSLETLGLKGDYQHINRTVGNSWWNEGSSSFFGPKDKVFFINLHWGKLVMLDLRDGKLMDEDWYAIAKGWKMPEANWKSLHQYAQRKLSQKDKAKMKDVEQDSEPSDAPESASQGISPIADQPRGLGDR